MKTVKLTDEAWARIMSKKYEWGARSISDIILMICTSQEDLQRSFWSIIKGEKTVEEWRKDLHYDQSEK